MGRVKDILIEAQNEFGQDFEFAPEGFSLDEYFKQRAAEVVESDKPKIVGCPICQCRD
jgi:hypothetical protein